MASFRKSKLFWLVMLLCMPSCAWLNPQKIANTNVQVEELDYFTISFARQDKLPITQLAVTEISSQAASGTSAYQLNPGQIAIRKLSPGETLYFSVDFGEDFEIPQFQVLASDPLNCVQGQYPVRIILARGTQDLCAPSGKSASMFTITGKNGDMYGSM